MAASRDCWRGQHPPPVQAVGSHQARCPDHRQRGAPGAADHQDPRRRRPAQGHPHRHPPVPRRSGSSSRSVGFVLSAWRWQRTFAVFDVHVPLRTLLGHYLAGQFVGNVLPSTIGGDVLRVSRAAKTTGTERHRVRVGGHRAPERLRRAPAPHARGLRARALAARARPLVDRARDRRRHRRRADRDPGRRRQPPPRGALRQAPELDALHRRGARGRRPHPPGAPAAR